MQEIPTYSFTQNVAWKDVSVKVTFRFFPTISEIKQQIPSGFPQLEVLQVLECLDISKGFFFQSIEISSVSVVQNSSNIFFSEKNVCFWNLPILPKIFINYPKKLPISGILF